MAGPYVRLAAKRHLTDLVTGPQRGLRWNLDAARLALGFFPEVLTVEVDGAIVPFKPLPCWEFVVGSIFGWQRRDADKWYRRFTRAYIEAGKGPLALGTPVPTPTGWTTMGELKAGDVVFDEAGRPVDVVGVTDTFVGRDCWQVTFDDGHSIVADGSHEWLTERRCTNGKNGDAMRGVPKKEWGKWHVARRTTDEIRNTLRYPNGKYQSANHSIRLCGALQTRTARLPIHPYVLGVWLGDGDSDCARVTCSLKDSELLHHVRACGYPVGAPSGKTRAPRYTIGTLHGALRKNRLLGAKHVPLAYMRASRDQRLALLQGLMDTDGTASPLGTCVFSNSNRVLAEAAFEIATSLGLKTTLRTGIARLNGREIGPHYSVAFQAPEQFDVFRLTRKRARCAPRHNRRRLSGDRRIVAIDRVPSEPVRCIEVDSPAHLFLAGRGMIPTGNSGKSPTLAGVGLYMMLADNEMSAECYTAGAKRDQAMIPFGDVVKMVDRSPFLRRKLVRSGKNPVWQLKHLVSGSTFRPLSADKQKSGQRVFFGGVDELHEHKDRYTIDMLQAGFKGRKQPLLFVITNSGFDRETICWEWHENAVAVVEGVRTDDTLFSFVMSLDDDDDPLEDETCWEKTNPGIGITVTREYLRSQVNDARQIPGREAGVRRLNFCQWTDAEIGWMTRGAWTACEEEVTTFKNGAGRGDEFAGEKGEKGARCFLGLDLSYAFDLTALAVVFPEGPNLVGWIEYFTPRGTAAAREKVDRVPYLLWIQQGLVHGVPGETVRKEYMARRIADIAGKFDVVFAAFDRYRHKELAEEMIDLGVDVPWIEHAQGFRRGGQLDLVGSDGKKLDNPLWMPESVRALEQRVLERTLRIQPSPVTRWQVSSVAVREDPQGNRVFDKKKAVGRIDGPVALAMAGGAAEMRLPVMSLRGFLDKPVMTR